MSDVVILELIKSVLWLLLIGGVLIGYRHQIGGLFESLGSVKIGGAAFTLGDRRKTAESYVLLAETLIDTLADTRNIQHLVSALTLSQVEKLGQFAQRYTASVVAEDWNEEMLRNIAFLLHNFGRTEQSIQLFDRLLSVRPDHIDFLDNKAFALLYSGLPQNVEVAEQIFAGLTNRFPARYRNFLRLAYCRSALGRHSEAIAAMRQAIILDQTNEQPGCLSDQLFYATRVALPDDYVSLEQALAQKSARAAIKHSTN